MESEPIQIRYFRATAGAAIQNVASVSQLKEIPIPLPPLAEQRRIVAELDAEAAAMEEVRGLLPLFEAKIQRVLDRVWGCERLSPSPFEPQKIC